MTAGATWDEQRWPLRPCPHSTPWWLRWMWWRRDGWLEINKGRLRLRAADGQGLGMIHLDEPAAVHLAVWPANRRDAWLSVTVGQQVARLTVQTRLPWSAVPDDAPILMHSCPRLRPEQFDALWATLCFAAELHGAPRLPEIREGRYSAEPRGLEVQHALRSARSRRKPPRRPPRVVASAREREALKAQIVTMEPDDFLRCSWCKDPTDVKAKNMIRHFDREHGGR